MATDIAIHICQLCKEDIAAGLDAKGFPNVCEKCQRKPHRTAQASTPRRRVRRP